MLDGSFHKGRGLSVGSTRGLLAIVVNRSGDDAARARGSLGNLRRVSIVKFRDHHVFDEGDEYIACLSFVIISPVHRERDVFEVLADQSTPSTRVQTTGNTVLTRGGMNAASTRGGLLDRHPKSRSGVHRRAELQ